MTELLQHLEAISVRRRVLVTYDVCEDKRLRKVFRTMRDFGDHLQFSV